MVRRLGLSSVAAVSLAIAFASVGSATITQQGSLRVKFTGKLSPSRLPRAGVAPVAISLLGDIGTVDHSAPPQLSSITISLNRYGRLHSAGLPRCHYHQIQPASTAEAIAACRNSLVGSGIFKAAVALPDQSPFPSNGRVLAFNGTLHGRPVIYAHIYGTKPVPISQLVIFRVHRIEGTYRVVLAAELPQVAAQWGHVDRISLTLRRTYRFQSRRQSYLYAGCPAPDGFKGTVFPFARAAFGFEDGRVLRSVLSGTCSVR